jgi:putative membrane protein
MEWLGLIAAGFLPFRGSVMLDVVFVAMFAIIPVLLLSVALVKRGRFQAHRNLQLTTAVVLLLAVIAFEVDMRFVTDWDALAKDSSLYTVCYPLLYLHLMFAIPTPILWTVVIIGAMRNFDRDFQAPGYRERHRWLGWMGMGLMLGTAGTGIVFYFAAFIA